MSTILLSGVGALGGWALEFLARSPSVERVVTIKRTPWTGPSRASLAMIGSVFQGHTKRFEHHEIDISDTAALAALLREVRPSAVVHSATVQSPRRLMNTTIDPALRATLRKATFGMWLPWHLLPATRLTEAIDRAGIETRVVNAAFPDAVNAAIWQRFGHGPDAGAGNVEICAAQVLRYLVDVAGFPADSVDVSLVGSHALLGYGPAAGVPYHLRVVAEGRDVTADYDLATMLKWPEPIAWSSVDVFSLFAASAVKNALALTSDRELRTHVTGPNGLPGGYPVRIWGGTIELDLPDGLDRDRAISINEQAAHWDGIDHIAADGTVVYTSEARDAMAELGHDVEGVGFDDLGGQSQRLTELYERLTMEGINA
jgi:hypothetical protein